MCCNTSSSCRGLQESIINYAGNQRPEFITCTHEEIAAGMGHGYFKIEGKPLAVMAHGTVGLQHASMAVYNAYCDRVPVFLMFANTLDATVRDWRVSMWQQSAVDVGAIVREYTKWDDTPVSLEHFAESTVRAYKAAMTHPRGPVLIVTDTQLQERPIPNPKALRIPALSHLVPPQGDAAAVAELAKLLVIADNPILVADLYAHSQIGVTSLVELAELLQAGVVSGGRMNFPSRHPLNQSLRQGAAIGEADLIVGLDVKDLYNIAHSFRDQAGTPQASTMKKGAKFASIGTGDLGYKSNFQAVMRYTEIDLEIAGDAEATMPALIEAVKRLITPDRRTAFQARGAKLAAASRAALEQVARSQGYAWEASPISTSRLAGELWNQIQHEDWSYPCGGIGVSTSLWNFDKHYQYLGGMGGGGLGYGPPATVGAALANRKYGRLTAAIIGDGDLMYTSGALWTAAHHRIPLLAVVHNNRAYHQEMMHMQRMGNRRNRGIDRAQIGCELTDPNIDFAKLAQSLGCYGEGPISNPHDLGPALKRAITVVKKGEPALVDVLTQAR